MLLLCYTDTQWHATCVSVCVWPWTFFSCRQQTPVWPELQILLRLIARHPNRKKIPTDICSNVMQLTHSQHHRTDRFDCVKWLKAPVVAVVPWRSSLALMCKSAEKMGGVWKDSWWGRWWSKVEDKTPVFSKKAPVVGLHHMLRLTLLTGKYLFSF